VRLRAIGLLLGTLAATALGLTGLAGGQSAPPIEARLFFTTQPAVAIPRFALGLPIPITLQVRATGAGGILTAQEFPETEFFRQLYFTRQPGGIVVSAASNAHRTDRTYYCLSRAGVLLPSAIPITPLTLLPGTSPGPPFLLEYQIPDAVAFYPDLRQGGHFVVQARIPLATFTAGDPNAIIADCDQFAGTAANVGPGAGAGRQAHVILSNTIEFTIGYRFVGFAQPVGDEAACSTSPCLTETLGRTIPVKFQLLDGNNQVVRTAVATISATQLSGPPPPQPPGDLGQGSTPINQFKFAAGNQYTFNLDTSVLSRGVWRISAHIDDGSVHSVEIRLR
jgi:hypothetical protein